MGGAFAFSAQMNAPASNEALREPRYFISATTADFGQFRQELRDRLKARSQEDLLLGQSTNLDKLADEIVHSDAVIHLAGPALGKGWTTPQEVQQFLAEWGPGIRETGDKSAVTLLRLLEKNPRFKVWPRTYWEAYLAILFGRNLCWIWMVPNRRCARPGSPRQEYRHPKPEAREHQRIASELGWDRIQIERRQFTTEYIASLVTEGNLIMRPRLFSALTLAPAVEPNYIRRPREEREICRWLNSFKRGDTGPSRSKLLSVPGEGNIGKTQMIAYCLRKCGLKIGINKSRNLAIFYLKGGSADGLTFLNLILGTSARLLPPSQRNELHALWPKSDALIPRWFALIQERGIRLLIWSDQSEHIVDANGQFLDPDILKWLHVWDQVENTVYLMSTTRKPVRVTKTTNRREVPLTRGLPPGAQTIQLFRRNGITKKQCPDTQLKTLIRNQHGLPGKLEGWIRLLDTHPQCGLLDFARTNPDDVALRLLDEGERNVLITIHILNQTAVNPTEIATVLQISVAQARKLLAGLKLWLIASEDAAQFALHDSIKASIEKFCAPGSDLRTRLTQACSDWLAKIKSQPPSSWDGPEDLEPFIQAVEILINAAMFGGAAHLLDTIDRQISPQASMLFRFGRAKDSRRLRSRLRQHLPAKSKIEWLNDFQLGLAEIRLGNDLAFGEAVLQSAVELAESEHWSLETAIALHYRALMAYQGSGKPSEGKALDETTALLQRAQKAVGSIKAGNRSTLGIQGNISGLFGVVSYRRAIAREAPPAFRRSHIDQAVRSFRRAVNLTGPKKSADHRAHRWWHLQHAKARCIQLLLRSRPPPAGELKVIADIAENKADVMEPETVSDAILFQSDLSRMSGQEHEAIDHARHGLATASWAGNNKMIVNFGLRLLLLTPEAPEKYAIRKTFQQLPYTLDGLLLPLRTSTQGNSPFAIPSAQIDSLRKFLEEKTEADISAAIVPVRLGPNSAAVPR
jgi:hypothetical protein